MRPAPKFTEKHIRRVRKTWSQMTRFGLPLYILGFGTVLLLWMSLCYVGFAYLFGTQRVLHQAFVLESTLPLLALASYFLVASRVWLYRQWIQQIGPEPDLRELLLNGPKFDEFEIERDR